MYTRRSWNLYYMYCVSIPNLPWAQQGKVTGCVRILWDLWITLVNKETPINKFLSSTNLTTSISTLHTSGSRFRGQQYPIPRQCDLDVLPLFLLTSNLCCPVFIGSTCLSHQQVSFPSLLASDNDGDDALYCSVWKINNWKKKEKRHEYQWNCSHRWCFWFTSLF